MAELLQDQQNDPIEQLRKHPQRYSFFQAIREIERVYSDSPRIGTALSPRDEPFRISQLAELTFAPNTVDRVDTNEDGLLRIDQRFFGVLGPSGALPTHLTETIRNRARHAGDDTIQSFIDMFHHRMATLFYRAWSSANPVVQRDRPFEDRFGNYLGTLSGIGTPASSHRDEWSDDTKQFFAGRLGSAQKNAEGLEAILGRCLNSQVKVEQFTLRWLPLSEQEVTSLSSERNRRRHSANNVLGKNTVLGNQVPDRQSLYEIQIGPVDFATFESFLPINLNEKSSRPSLETIPDSAWTRESE